MLIFIPFYWFEKNKLFKQILIFLSIYQFSNMVRKTNFLSKSILVYEIVIFLTKKKSSLRISSKCFKTTERHSLAVCGSLCGEKQFLLIFIPFYWFEQKRLLKQILIILSIFHFQTW